MLCLLCFYGEPHHQLLTHSEVAEYLGISEAEVDQLNPPLDGTAHASSEIPYVRIGDTTYFPVKAIDKWLSEIQAFSVE
ncbi:helix-turn-helix domain-containing protein [Paenibacillus wynnii]|uniref:helix-turn-helix domain-containing protein n=1 Tax=Paenibacillus wynnii TaxID=268407 RepID=UPI0027D88BDC|nr:helix-turn-helix domain-containing protein [Paenibacillus wynnii]